MLRKIVAAVILIPLAIVIIAFAVANRQIVTVSLDPFSSEHPASSLTLPLFALILVLLIAGVVIGGVAAWLRQAKWRRVARRLEREADALRGEVTSLRRSSGSGTNAPEASSPPERLQLRLPVR
ncbi:MAG: LapA family protein [Xanthobacteraceae bacterium]